MSIRRVGKANRSAIGTVAPGKSRHVEGMPGEDFARRLAEVSGSASSGAVEKTTEAAAVAAVGEREASHHQRDEQLSQTGEILDTLEALGRDLGTSLGSMGGAKELTQKKLRETRDLALRTLSDTPARGEERDLLYRTAVLATVELAKSERGDYK